MIVFSFECLADDSHRRHFIDRWAFIAHDKTDKLFKPDYAAYYAAAADDKPIEATIKIMSGMFRDGFGTNLIAKEEIEIWCNTPQVYQHIIEDWLDNHTPFERTSYKVKMRPDGDTTPWHELKEKWLQEMIKWPELEPYDESTKDKIYRRGDKPEMAFERSGSPMIETWKLYGVPCMEVHV